MNRQGEGWTVERVLALAPDAASRKAAGRLAAAASWSGTGAHGQAVWGLCAGSGSAPYRTVVDLTGPAYRCGCPSRKFPCKHALGLLLLWAGEPGVRGSGEPPEWAARWLAERRERAERAAAGGPGRTGEPGPAGAGQAAAGPEGTGPEGAGPEGGGPAAVADPEAARQRAERRARRVAAGATELEQRLADLLREGLAGADRAGYAPWDEMAARMVDAQAPGLEARVRELGAIPSSGPGWPGRLLEECALLHLLGQGFLRVEELPGGLAATTRARVGLTPPAAEVLAAGEPVRDRWLVLGGQDSADGRVTTRRIWLRGERTDRMAVLLSYGAAGRPPGLALPPGLVLDADLAYHPAARPLRAVLGARYGEPGPPETPVPAGVDIGAALAAYGEALRDDPWLDSWPVVVAHVTPVPRAEGWQLADGRTGSALPVDPRCLDRTNLWQLAAVSGGAPVTVFGTCGHRGFTPVTTWDPEPVPLQEQPSGTGAGRAAYGSTP
ncbi:SWIM zinc finger family protein [Streptomyces sp. B1866]|uniref:SWIM zinc finger family protein n=1 Tax=Streptomyces sp. B1866 TaxID=3075431 RepID=UPI00288F9425|nr:SWIM zinc finger family protein [Streptomyces sp. B1866]MDT3400573.1 SWIM zinc finger family protein [Streptomyces sp. B1866]